jgi:hypothetical protein
VDFSDFEDCLQMVSVRQRFVRSYYYKEIGGFSTFFDHAISPDGLSAIYAEIEKSPWLQVGG